MNQPGIYYGTLKEYVLSETDTNKKPQVIIQFSVTHQVIAGEWKAFGPQDRKAYLSLSGAAFKYTTAKLRKLGWNKVFGDKMEITPPFDEEKQKVKGFQLECTVERYQGRDKERWDLAGFGDGGSMDANPLNSDMVHRLNALYAQQEGDQRQAVTSEAPAPTPATPNAGTGEPANPAAPTGAASTIEDDDIPF